MSKIKKNSYRYDQGTIEPLEFGDGFLRAKVTIARTGVFPYLRGDGKIQREAKLPDDLFSLPTIDSAKGAPVTDGHPPRSDSAGFVTPKNYKQHAKGALGDSASVESDHLELHETVYDESLIADLKAGKKREVSIGFICDVDCTPGEFRGQRYDARQINIRINHLAHVDEGRGGESVRVHLDSSDGDVAAMTKSINTGSEKDKEHSMEKFFEGLKNLFEELFKEKAAATDGEDNPDGNPASDTTDGDPGDGTVKKDDADIRKKAGKQSPVKQDSSDVKKMQARIDALEAMVKKLTAQKTEKDSVARMDEAISARMKLVDSARAVLKDYKHDGKTDREIKLDVITKLLPFDETIKTDSLDAVYIDARYDAAMSLAREKALDADEATGVPRIDENAIAQKKAARLNMQAQEGK